MVSALSKKAGAMVLLGLLQFSVIYVLIYHVIGTSPRQKVSQGDNKERSAWEHLNRMQHDVTVLKVKVAALERGQQARSELVKEERRQHGHAPSQAGHESAVKGDNRLVQEAQEEEQELQGQQEEEEQELQGQQEEQGQGSHSFMLARDWTHWRDDSASCNLSQTFPVARMKTPVGSLRVHVHEPEEDRYVSKRLLRDARWEGGLLQTVLRCLMADQHLAFLDIGANVGVYTLTAAKLGRRVVAVEPFPSNVQRLCRSLQDNHLQSHVTLVRNALSDARQLLSFKVRKGSVGHTQVQDATKNATSGDTAQAILLDDVVELLRDVKGVVIKMDVEGHEARVLGGARNFFRQLPVPCLLMEWGIVKKSPAGSQAVLKFMAEHDLQPFNPDDPSSSLRQLPPGEWPGNVLWLKTGQQALP